MLGLATAGVGIAVLPDYLVAAALAAGEVIRVVPGRAKERPGRAARNAIVLAWRRGVAGSARVQAVREGLLARRSE